jgi:hypothetical protein
MNTLSPAQHQARIRLVSEGVVASYIHEISARTPSGAGPHQDSGRPSSYSQARRKSSSWRRPVLALAA